MLELLLELIGEFVVQAFGELLFEGFFQFRRTNRTFAVLTAAVGYLVLGALLGAVSLLIFREHFIRSPSIRVVALVAVPVAVGVVMSLVGSWRARRGDSLVRLDRFSFAALMALGTSLVRWYYAS
jgi:hypothetical protein